MSRRPRRAPVMEGIFDWLKREPAKPEKAPPPRIPKPAIPPGIDFYAVLGVPPDATDEEIRTNYRDLARKFHPDRNPGDPVAAEYFVLVSKAYEILRDAEVRAEYDRARAATPPAAVPPRAVPPPAARETRELVPAPPPMAPSAAPPPPSPLARFAPWFMPPPPAAVIKPPVAPPAAPPKQPGVWEALWGPPEQEPWVAPPPMTPSRAPGARQRAPWEGPPTPPPQPQKPQLPVPVPPVAVPQPTYGYPTPPSPEIFPRPEEMAAFMQEFWPLDQIWEVVREARTRREFETTRSLVVDRLAGLDPREGVEYELASWLNIAPDIVDDYRKRGLLTSALWRDVFYPMFDIAAMALELVKPPDLPGRFYLFISQDGFSVDLYYTEA